MAYMKENKDKLLNFLLALSLMIMTAVLIYSDSTHQAIYSFTFNPVYIALIFLSLAFAFLIILGIKPFSFFPLVRGVRQKLANLFFYILFLPFAIYPIIRCYFKIPYLFCHVCPTKCIFGHVRPYVFPAFLSVNLDKRFWCFNWCPFGKFQDTQSSLTKKKIVLPRFLSVFRYIVLALIIFLYFQILYARKNPAFVGTDIYLLLFKNAFSFSLTVFVVFIIIFAFSFFINRFFCNYFCPIGAVSDALLKVQKRLKL